jgi:hypothetical protein
MYWDEPAKTTASSARSRFASLAFHADAVSGAEDQKTVNTVIVCENAPQTPLSVFNFIARFLFRP